MDDLTNVGYNCSLVVQCNIRPISIIYFTSLADFTVKSTVEPSQMFKNARPQKYTKIKKAA
jgi:hypothetical protein